MPATPLLHRRRLAWHTWLDMPIGLAPSPATSYSIVFGEPGLSYHDLRAGVAPGWLVLLGISNPGQAPVRGSDFPDPLGFSFPGRQVRSARISPEPGTRAARPPRIRLLPAPGPSPGRGGHGPARVQLAGDFLLRPGDGYAVILLLTA